MGFLAPHPHPEFLQSGKLSLLDYAIYLGEGIVRFSEANGAGYVAAIPLHPRTEVNDYRFTLKDSAVSGWGVRQSGIWP
ncbi:MAG: hypothetical protein DDT27_01612 [Dehalococcoidia bacterium]|nr:hypothetical protein [Chloroflexota bacterium]